MNTSEKIRQHFVKFPNAKPSDVAKKFSAHKPLVYKLRKDVLAVHDLPAPVTAPTKVDNTLDERAHEYGRFKDGAALMQGIKRLLADHAARHNKTFADDQWEAIEMIVHKLGRIINGNPDKVDHWVDIAGYATLISDRLEGHAR